MSVLIDFSIFPVDKGESLSSYVARAVKIIRFSEQAQVPWLPRVNDLKDQAGEMRAQGLSGRGTGGHLRIRDEHYKIISTPFHQGARGYLLIKLTYSLPLD